MACLYTKMICFLNGRHAWLPQPISWFHQCLVSGSLDWVGSEGFPGAGSNRPWLLTLLLAEFGPDAGNNHCWECSWVWMFSESSNDRATVNVADLTCFGPKDSFKGKRQTGQVDCFLSHISMHERWKLWPHFGIILSISFSSYSPRHIEHLQTQRIEL